MAGIYLHIPFCKQACTYCDFHFSTSLQRKTDMLDALAREIEQQRDYLAGAEIDTIYFGGGTPSLLSASEISRLIGHIRQFFRVKTAAEITVEANPDDLTKSYLNALRQTDVNRFSIGIQSFFDEDLRWMNRAHNAGEADAAAKRAQDAGFENLSIDLIYGFPLLSDAKWTQNLHRAIGLGVPHISAYALTVEPRTALAHQIAQKAQPAPDDGRSAAQFGYLMDTLAGHDFEQYEISNFCRPGHYSRHNTSYWTGDHYLGIGPSAHSFNGESRQWNIAQNTGYMHAILQGENSFTREELTARDKLNEFIMIRLRMATGIDLGLLDSVHDLARYPDFRRTAEKWLQSAHLEQTGSHLRLTRSGKFFADKIAADLFAG